MIFFLGLFEVKISLGLMLGVEVFFIVFGVCGGCLIVM